MPKRGDIVDSQRLGRGATSSSQNGTKATTMVNELRRTTICWMSSHVSITSMFRKRFFDRTDLRA